MFEDVEVLFLDFVAKLICGDGFRSGDSARTDRMPMMLMHGNFSLSLIHFHRLDIFFFLNFNLLTLVINSYRPSISSQFVKDTLAFVDVGKCVEWLASLGVVFQATDKQNVDCKTSMGALAAL